MKLGEYKKKKFWENRFGPNEETVHFFVPTKCIVFYNSNRNNYSNEYDILNNQIHFVHGNNITMEN